MGLVIKNPKKAAGEYAKHSVSIYRRCPNQCLYCFLDKGIGKGTLGSGKPELRTCFYNEDDAVKKFQRELLKNREQLIKDGGVFFCFITDPCLPDTINATKQCAMMAMNEGVPVTILTKMVSWVYKYEFQESILELGKQTGLLCVGFTLTGRDDMEPNADPNLERILAMQLLHEDFERIDEEYAKRKMKAADEAFGAPKMYVRANVIDQKFPLLTKQEIASISFRFLKHPFRMRKEDARKLEELLIEHQPSRESQIFANHIFPSTLTQKPEDNWLYGQYFKDMVKEKQRDKILFKFGEFVGQLSKEEKVSFTDIVNVLLEFIENNITKKK